MISFTAAALAGAAHLSGSVPLPSSVPLIAAQPVAQFDPAPSAQVPPPADAFQTPAPETPAPAADAAMQADPAAANGLPPDPSLAGEVPSLTLRDPWEKPNRAIWDFDVFFERKLLAPVAHGYQAVAPQGLRNSLSNAVYNLEEPLYFLNNMLQLKLGRAVKTGVRFFINSTLGVAGLFDVAAKGGLNQRRADFGQTLARWGAKPGPFVMIPFLGPSNVRDGFGRLVDTLADPVGFVIGGVFTSYPGAGRLAASGVNWRQANDGTMKAIYGAQDPYAFLRSAYSQQRAAAVQDVTGKAAQLPDF